MRLEYDGLFIVNWGLADGDSIEVGLSLIIVGAKFSSGLGILIFYMYNYNAII